MSFDQCVGALRQVAGDLSDEQIEQVAEQVDRLIKRARRTSPDDPQAASRAVDAFAEDIQTAALIEQRNAVINARKTLELVDYITHQWAGREAEGLDAVLTGSEKLRKGARNGVAQSQTYLAEKYRNGFITDLDKAGLRREFISGRWDADIFEAMDALHLKDADRLAQLPKEAVTLAKVIDKYNELARIDANQAGAWIRKEPGYVVKRTHDMYKIRAVEPEEWLRDVNEWLDFERTMPDVDDMQAELSRLHTQFANGVHLHASKGGPSSALKGFANIGKKLSHERVLHFKNPAAEYAYYQKYGVGNLADSMLYGLERMAQETALMRHLGPNAEMNFDAAVERVAKQLERRGGQALGKFTQQIANIKRTRWPNITGAARVPANEMLAKISADIRTWMQMTKLGRAALSSVVDIPLSGLETRYQGGGFLRGMGEAIGALFEGKTSLEKQEIIAELGVVFDGLTAGVLQRFDVSDPVHGALAKAGQHFMGLNCLRPWTDRLRTRLALGLSHRLSLYADKPLPKVSPELQRVLSLYGIDEGKWDLVRAGTQRAADNRAYMTPEGLDDVPDAAFAKYLADHGQKATPARIRDLRTEIKDQFGSMFNDRATAGILEPNAKTRAILLQGTQAGTWVGEAFRHFALFKAFPVTMIQRVLGREFYGRGSDTVMEALKNGHGELVGLAELFVSSIAFGYLAMSLKDLAAGKEPRPLDDPRTYIAAMAQGGALGIYGDFLFGELKNRYGGGPLSTALGPTAGTFEDITDVIGRVVGGDDASAQTLRLLLNTGPTAPLTNLFYTRWAFDYLIAYRLQEMASPGYLRRREKAVKRQTDQDFIVPPSDVIPYGG